MNNKCGQSRLHLLSFFVMAGIILHYNVTAATGPCDIYASANTPCVAAYSTVRALYGNYSGNLYQVRRISDNATKNITPLSAGGVANAATQEAFCSGKSSCTISIIYDQTGNGNNLTKAPGGSETYGSEDDIEAVADSLPIYINGNKVYGVHVTPGSCWTCGGQVGYRTTTSKGVATGDSPETTYMVTDGTYYNGSCCFDFGNALMEPKAGANGSMDAIYFGSCDWWDTGAGDGPWIMADLESGVYNMDGAAKANNSKDISLPHPFVTAMLKSNSNGATTGGPFTIKGGNAKSGSLQTMWDGGRPTNYEVMHKGGGVVLGIGGDNSSTAKGNFYEGVLTSGYATTATDNAIQANIVAARYGETTTVILSSSSGTSSSSVESSSSTVSSSSVQGSSSSSTIAEIAYSVANIPGTIQAENYNIGGEGVSYHDTDTGNSGNVYRVDDVDIDTVAAGGYALGWLVAGEWTEYTVNSTTAGTLAFHARVASGGDGGAFHLELDGTAITSSISVPNTGSYTTYQTIDGEVSGLVPSSHMLRIVIDSSYFNIDWIQFGDSEVSIRSVQNFKKMEIREYQVFDLDGKYLGTVTASDYLDIRSALQKKFSQPGVYIVRYRLRGKAMQNLVVNSK
jgi:hypothetical protein